MHDKDFTTINSWRDLIPFGINSLTMESCAYNMRMLCDLSEEGVLLLQNYFGFTENCFAKNWNRKVGDKKSVASIMLSTNSFSDIACFALLQNGYEVAVKYKDTVDGMSRRTYKTLREEHPTIFHKSNILFAPTTQDSYSPSINGRNVHAYSGRSK